MYGIPVKTLLEAGVHFGHRASRWNPKMGPYIFGKRNLIHIIDLKQTLRGLLKACSFLQQLSAQGKQILYVGTKRQAQNVVMQEANRVGMPFVAERWLGGTLTNFTTIRSRLRRLEHLEGYETDGTFASMSKKEIANVLRERRKIYRNLHGMRKLGDLPGAIIIVDPKKEKTAVQEAKKMGIPTIAILDTDCDPGLIDIPVPGNDDALRSVQVLLGKLTDAISAGASSYQQFLAEEEKRRQDDEARHEAAKKQRNEDNKKRQSDQAELEKILKKAREERAKRLVAEEGEQARAEHDAGDVSPAGSSDANIGDTTPGPLGPEPTAG